VKTDDDEPRHRLLGRETLREVLVVVASILIAFSLDAWWSGLIERRQLREQLGIVLTELEGGQDELREAVLAHRLYGGAASAFRERLSNHGTDERVLVPDTLVGALFSHFTMDVTTSATAAFVEAGGQAIIADRLAREALGNWPARIRDAIDDQAQLRAGIQGGYHPYMISTFSLGNAFEAGSDMIVRGIRADLGLEVPPFRSPPATLTLRATPELLNHLSWRISNESVRLRQMESLVVQQDSLISALRVALSR
jgi:hypothetical protein